MKKWCILKEPENTRNIFLVSHLVVMLLVFPYLSLDKTACLKRSIYLKLPNVFTTATVFTIHEDIQFPCDLKNLIFSWFENSLFVVVGTA